MNTEHDDGYFFAREAGLKVKDSVAREPEFYGGFLLCSEWELREKWKEAVSKWYQNYRGNNK